MEEAFYPLRVQVLTAEDDACAALIGDEDRAWTGMMKAQGYELRDRAARPIQRMVRCFLARRLRALKYKQFLERRSVSLQMSQGEGVIRLDEDMQWALLLQDEGGRPPLRLTAAVRCAPRGVRAVPKAGDVGSVFPDGQGNRSH